MLLVDYESTSFSLNLPDRSLDMVVSPLTELTMASRSETGPNQKKPMLAVLQQPAWCLLESKTGCSEARVAE